MTYTLTRALNLGPAHAGIAAELRAALVDENGSDVGSPLAGVFADQGDGSYLARLSVDDDHRGGVRFYHDATGQVFGTLSINPGDVELVERIAAGSIGVALSAGEAVYHGRAKVSGHAEADQWTVVWLADDDEAIVAASPAPTLQVIGRDGTGLFGPTAMTPVGSLSGTLKHDEVTGRLAGGESYVVILRATIDGAERVWTDVIRRGG